MAETNRPLLSRWLVLEKIVGGGLQLPPDQLEQMRKSYYYGARTTLLALLAEREGGVPAMLRVLTDISDEVATFDDSIRKKGLEARSRLPTEVQAILDALFPTKS